MYQFAIIGCGRIAPRHAQNIATCGKLVAVCDIDKSKADAFANEYGAAPYYSIDDLLSAEKGVAIVVVCTPNGFHAEHSIKALQARKHVLCEKPMCLASAAAWQLLETEKFSRRKLFVVKSARYNPLLIELQKQIKRGDLGTIYSFQLNCFWNRPQAYYTGWRGKAFPDGGTLYTQFSHYIDALVWLFGDIKQVTGFAANKAHGNSIEFEDTGVAALQLKSGVLGGLNWSVNTFEENSEIALTIIAERGTISLGGEYLNEIRYQQTANPFLQSADGLANDYGFYKGSMSNHDKVYENLLKSLQNNEHPFTNTMDGLKTVEAIEQIYKAVNWVNNS